MASFTAFLNVVCVTIPDQLAGSLCCWSAGIRLKTLEVPESSNLTLDEVARDDLETSR